MLNCFFREIFVKLLYMNSKLYKDAYISLANLETLHQGGSPVHVDLACTRSGEGSNHFDTLHQMN
jgi:hypothetical protein